IVVAAATAVIMVIMVITLINWGSLFPKKAETEATVETVATEAVEVAAEVTEEVAATQVQEELPAETALTIEETWYMYYHYLLLNDDNLADDFDFGPTAWAEGLTAEEALEEMIARVKADPALGAAAFASFDVRLGTDLMYPGIHYDQNWSDGYWTSLISQYVKVYQADEVLYRKLVDRWEEFVRKYAQVTLTYQEGIKDQMYMISLTSASELEAPEVIVAAADQPSGHVLNFAFLIKGNQFNVPFRTDCGFQPTNVAEPMKETPKELPKDPQISSGGGGSTPSGGSDPAPRKKKQTERQTEHQTEKQTERQTNPPETGTPQTGTPETPKPQPETPKPQPETPKQTEKQTDPPQPETPKPQTETSKPQPETPKDPSKSTTVNVAPNDDPGITGDVSTNNGDGATTSTAELPANSNNMTQPEYVETVQELAQINAEQKTGSEPSIPSTPTVQPASAQPAQSAQPAEPVSVDNPADNPATVAPINDATPQVAADTVAGDPESVGMIGTPD
ncbi:MAG: hypothetical protein IKG01_02035, partial [Lachnospiraceae bacterium]|nr:hypothetical protein [Lachnospiraceae bacterium]